MNWFNRDSGRSRVATITTAGPAGIAMLMEPGISDEFFFHMKANGGDRPEAFR
jgi:hypothetical protein